jgi:hypothetical protein
MTLDKLIRIKAIINDLAICSGSSPEFIIDILSGYLWDEEDVGELKQLDNEENK